MTFNIYNLSSGLINKVFKEKHKLNYKHYYVRRYYNVLFFGSDIIGLNSLRKVNEYRNETKQINRLDLVTTNNSKTKTSIEKYAQMENIDILPWSHLNLNERKYDIGLIVAFGHLIKKDVLDKFPLGMVNVHPSLLPRWRGAAPIIHTLLHGDEVGGVSLMKIKPDIFDVGEIISQIRVPISKDVKLQELTEQLSTIGAGMLIDCLKLLPKSLENSHPQSNNGVTYAKKINKTLSEVRWTEMTATEVYNLYRAIYGLFSLTTVFRGKQMKLFNAFLLNEEAKHPDEVGSIGYCEKADAIRVLCKDKNYIYFKSARIVGKREISALDFYNGYIKNVTLDKRICKVC